MICVTTGILDKLNRVELEGVVAHEMSHIKNYDVRLQTVVVVMAGVVALLSDWMLRSFIWGGGGGGAAGPRRLGRGRGHPDPRRPGPGRPLADHRPDHPAGHLP